MDPGVKETMLSRLHEMLPEDLQDEVEGTFCIPTAKVWVGEVEDKKANETLKRVGKAKPLKGEGFEYVRRIVRNKGTGRLEMVFGKDREGAEAAGLSSLRQAEVPARFPATPEGWRHCCDVLWPLSRPAPPPSSTRPTQLADATLQYIHDSFSTMHASHPKGGIIVDPATHTVVAGADEGWQGAYGGPATGAHPLDHCCMRLVRAVAAAQRAACGGKSSRQRSEGAQYLLSGYDAFLFSEPCVMCAMALLHSRLGRLFFLRRNETFGGASERHPVHCHPRLNHHYPAYHYAIPEDKLGTPAS